jgi:hypothetical protein
MQENVEVFLVRAAVEMLGCGEPDCGSRSAFIISISSS